MREHLTLARHEVRTSLTDARRVSLLFGTAALAGLCAALFLATTLALGFNAWIPGKPWAGFGIVGLLCIVAAAILFVIAKARLPKIKEPLPQTTAALKDDAQWITTTLKSP
jgi:hypothetical protein